MGEQPPRPRHPLLGCTCSEGHIVEHGHVRFLPGVHSCDYVRMREQHITAAMHRADAAVRRRFSSWTFAPDKHALWGTFFMEYMNTLCGTPPLREPEYAGD